MVFAFGSDPARPLRERWPIPASALSAGFLLLAAPVGCSVLDSDGGASSEHLAASDDGQVTAAAPPSSGTGDGAAADAFGDPQPASPPGARAADEASGLADEPGDRDHEPAGEDDAPDATDGTGEQGPGPDEEVEQEPDDGDLTTAAVQERLRELGYLIGPADGEAGQQTDAAVMAFQRVQGLEVDGIVGPITTQALLGEPLEPELAGGPDDRIEVDLDLQLLHLVEGGERRVTLHVSSGNGTSYVASSGNDAEANTPVGEYVIERRVHGVREANLGVLHDPLYFHRGFAIHGAPSVPAAPASLGCVRVSIADGAWLIEQVVDGLPVHLYGGEHVYTPIR